MPRGRPKGTHKREHAIAAAKAIHSGEFAEVREAALAHFAAHTGRKAAPLSMADASRLERFRDFVRYVEEAYRELIRTEPGSLRRYRALAKRSANRRVQPNSAANPVAKLKRELNRRPLHRLRVALGLEADDAI